MEVRASGSEHRVNTVLGGGRFSSVSMRNTTAPFQTGSSLHELLWPCHGSKAVLV